MKIPAYYDPGYAAPIGDHVMPITKFSLVAEALRDEPDVELLTPSPLVEADLLRVHSAEYVDAVRKGEPRALAESQKFPWSAELFESVLRTGGGCLAAAGRALETGVAAALVSGFHHAHADHGEGFCTFNGLVVSIDALLSGGRIERAAVLDLDLHYGNGTAALAEGRPHLFNLSIYGNDYRDNQAFRDVAERRHDDGPNHQSIALANGSGREEMLIALEQGFERILDYARPDLVIYQAGADPYFEDPYSPLRLDHEDLFLRDRRVFEWAKQQALPIAWVLAGGYTEDTTKVVRVHLNTFRAAIEVFGTRARPR